MRKILAASILSLALAACDSSTGGGGGSDPETSLLTLTVLTGTKGAPVDTPTVRLAWAGADTVSAGYIVLNAEGDPVRVKGWVQGGRWYAYAQKDTTLKAPCDTGDTWARVIAWGSDGPDWSLTDYADTVTVYCSAKSD